MAKTYWQREDSSTLTPFQARLSADGIDIYEGQFDSDNEFVPPHPLRNCMTFQWQRDADLTGTFTDIAGANNATYLPDTSSVANSGAFRCMVTLGCDTFTTEAETLSIIDCIDLSQINIDGAGGNGSRAITWAGPSYEPVVITSSSWITTSGSNPTTVSAAQGTGARNGYVEVAIGEFVCTYPVQQGWVPMITQMAPIPADTNPSVIPTIINWSMDVEVLQGQNVQWFANATYTKAGQTVDTHPITWEVTINGVTVTGIMPIENVANSNVFGFFKGTDTTYGTLELGETYDMVFTASNSAGSDTKTGTFTLSEDMFNVPDEPIDLPDGMVSCDTFGILGRSTSSSPSESNYQICIEGGAATVEIDFNMFSPFFMLPEESAIPVEFEFEISGPNVVGGTFNSTTSSVTASTFQVFEIGSFTPVTQTFGAGTPISIQPGGDALRVTAAAYNTAFISENLPIGTYDLTLRLLTDLDDIVAGRTDVQNPYITFNVEPYIWFEGLDDALSNLNNLNFG